MGVALIVHLGGFRFNLRGLTSVEAELLIAQWGIFCEVRDTPGHLTWEIDFASTSQPSQVDYRRGADVAISLSADQHITSWTDRSLGALEATLQVALQWALAEHGGLLVHASAGVYQGEGWLMPGVSGAGKSTAAREGGFDLILSDELVIVLPELLSSASQSTPQSGLSKAYRLYSTPFWSEGRVAPLIWADAPLNLIAFPHKASHAELISCQKSEALLKLIRAVTLYERSQDSHRLPQRIPQRSELFEHAYQVVEQSEQAILAFPRWGPWRHSLRGSMDRS